MAPRATVRSEAASAPLAAASAPKTQFETTDSAGRVIVVRKIGAARRMDVAEVLGPQRIGNAGIVSYAMAAFSVVSIDGDPVAPPTTYPELRHLVDRLDDHGLDAVSNVWAAQGWLDDLAEPKAADLKNS